MAIVIPKNELNEFSLPRVCVATGNPGAVTFQKVQFQFIPKWVAIFAVAPLLYLIFFMLLRKTASGALPFSEGAWANVKAARRNVGLAALGLVVGCVLGAVVSAQVGDDRAFLVFFVALIAGIIFLVVMSLRLKKVFPVATLIDDQKVTLTLPSAEAERLFADHLRAGARAP
jgi:hypothetical protein